MKPLRRVRPRQIRPLEELMSSRIHYACGKTILPGWLNVDGVDETFPHGRLGKEEAREIFFMDLTKKHPFPDESFAFGYSEDFLEHLDQAESLIFLSEVYRTFQPGGVIRISTPGLAGVLRRHLRGATYEAGVACREEAYARWRHRHFYAEPSLKLVAEHIGFSRVIRCAYGESEHPELRHDQRFDQADLNLVVELTK